MVSWLAWNIQTNWLSKIIQLSQLGYYSLFFTTVKWYETETTPFLPFKGHVGKTSSSSSQHLHTLHLQQRIHGAANSKKGDATSNNTPKPANIPTTCKENILIHVLP